MNLEKILINEKMITDKRKNILLKLNYWIDKKEHEEICQSNYLIDSVIPLLNNIENVSELEVNNVTVDMAYEIAYYVVLIIERLEYELTMNKAGVK